MTATKPLIVHAENGLDLDMGEAKITILASSEQTGSGEVTFQSGPEGFGPPPHFHAWDESFYVLKGSVEFSSGEDVALCKQGSLVHVPGGVIHAFQFGVDGGEMLEFTGAGSGAAALFTTLSKEMPPGPPDFAKAVELFARHGATIQI